MSKTVNEVHLIGRAGKSVEVKYTPSGKQLAKFSLATEGYKTKAGKEIPANWHQIICWDIPNAENVEKGNEIELWGRIQYSSWEDKTSGETKYKTEIVANKLELAIQQGEKEAEPPRAATPYSHEITDSDIPF